VRKTKKRNGHNGHNGHDGHNGRSDANGDEEGSRVYYDEAGRPLRLYAVPDLLAVRFEPGRRSLSREAIALLSERNAPLLEIENYGIVVYRSEVRDRAVSMLSKEDAVEHAATVFRRSPHGQEIIVVTKRFIAEFRPGTSRARIDEINAAPGHQVRIVRSLDPEHGGELDHTYVLEGTAKDQRNGIDYANAYRELPEVKFAEPDLIQRRAAKQNTRAAPRKERVAAADSGSYLDRQWHLERANVIEAWRQTKGDPSINIAIFDDGVDVTHPEFRVKIKKQADFSRLLDDGQPGLDGSPQAKGDKHGTACTGVATAAGVKAFGVAPGCSLMAVRTPDYMGTADEAAMFLWAADNGADVISCSWGAPDGVGGVDPLPAVTRKAIREITRRGGRGRGGKGIPIFWAAGNGNESVMDDGYASNPDVMAIAASTSKDTRAWYSDKGAALCVCAPSSGDAASGEKAIFTADRRGAEGYNKGTAALRDTDYCLDFGGTSSSTPLVAGIAALMLSKNPELTPAEIRALLQKTAKKIGSAKEYVHGHSSSFGAGLVDAAAAVLAATADGPLAKEPEADPPTIRCTQKTLSRTGPAPTFEVDPGPNAYYAVEVATRGDLLDPARKAERSASNFFASWKLGAKGPYLSEPRFQVPQSAWALLRSASRLYYRAITSASSDQYVDCAFTTPNEQLDRVPSVKIEGGNARTVKDGTASSRPLIIGPSEHDRTAGPPIFTIVPQENGNDYFAVQVGTRAALLKQAGEGQRTEDNFYGSYEEGRLLEVDGISHYTLPDDTWARLRKADRLYYRVVTTSSPDGWTNERASTDDGGKEHAPSISIVGAHRGRRAKELPIRTTSAGRLSDEAHWHEGSVSVEADDLDERSVAERGVPSSRSRPATSAVHG